MSSLIDGLADLVDEELLPAWEGVEAGLPQGDAAGVLLLLGFRLPLLASRKSRDNQLSTVFTFHVQTLFLSDLL
jgi:hypothetical protein